MEAPELLQNLEGFGDIKVEVAVLLGTAPLPIEQFLKLGRGSIVELTRGKEELVDVLVNGHPLAKGLITVQGTNVGVEIKEIVPAKVIKAAI